MFETQNSTRSAWERLGNFQPVVLLTVFVITTPIAIAIGMAHAVEGDFTSAKITIPLTTIALFTLSPDRLHFFWFIIIGVSAVQFLLYGTIISFARHRARSVLIVVTAHCVFVIAAFICGHFLER